MLAIYKSFLEIPDYFTLDSELQDPERTFYLRFVNGSRVKKGNIR